MSTESCHTIQAPGGGTSRLNRLLKSLLPDYVAVDGKSMEDLQQFAIQLAQEIKYASPTGWEGDWSSFFEKKIEADQLTDPHFALFLAFLQNFKLAQSELNALTKRHLDFFYRDILRLQEKSAEPDQAYLIFQLAKNVNESLVPKKSVFKAGKDNTGVEIHFENQQDQILNRAEVASLKALYRDENGRLFSSPVANSSDGQGSEILDPTGRWSPFGSLKSAFPDSDRPQAILGFALASPVLELAEGLRKLSLTLTFQPQEGLLAKLQSLHLNSSFRFFLSGEKDWIEAIPGFPIQDNEKVDELILAFINNAKSWVDIAGIEPQSGPVLDDPETGVHKPFRGYDIGEVVAKNLLAKRDSLPEKRFKELKELDQVRGFGPDKLADLIYTFRTQKHELKNLGSAGVQLILKCHLIPDQAAVVGYSEEVLLQKIKTKQSVLKVQLAETSQSYSYPILEDASLNSVHLHVDVEGVSQLILQNDLAPLPVGKNIHPFGFRPVSGSSFYIGSREVFSKQLLSLKLHADWHGLPSDEKGFTDYYDGYSGSRSNENFTVNVDFLNDKIWKTTNNVLRLFEQNNKLANSQSYALDLKTLGNIPKEPELEPFGTYSPDRTRGFVRLTLNGSDFGHSTYPMVFATQILKKSKDEKPEDVPLPNEPYSPELKSIRLDYTAEETFQVKEDPWNSFYHLDAFGEARQPQFPCPLLPKWKAEGSLLIGLKNHLPGQSIQLLIHVLDGSSNPELAVPPVSWSYLNGNSWRPLEKLDLALDETAGLIQTGLHKFTLPRAADTEHTVMPNGLTWIKASVPENSEAIPDFTQILAQAIKVSFIDQGNDPLRLAAPLPAKSIAKLKVPQTQISKINQPFASFGGKTKEASADFYTRVSERLRHKQRAITRWDYEHLVLEQFPEIYQVKVLNHTHYDGNLEAYRALAPRHVTVVLVANVQNKNALDPLRPKASVALIEQVRSFLQKINGAGVFLHIVNPVYEELQVKTKVRFLAGFDRSFYAKKLEDDLKAFLSPWAFAGIEDFNFSGKIHQSVVLHFIEKLPYVDFLSCFELYHVVVNPINGEVLSKTKVEEAVGSRGVSLLGSIGQIDHYGDHLIEVLETEECDCPDNEVLATSIIASSESSDMIEAFPT